MPLTSLEALGPTIQEICSICGVAGVSIGVIHYGEVLYKANFGFRDVKNKIKGDEETIYYLGSMTKGFTAEAIGILVEDGKLNWTTPVKDILPEFRPNDEIIRNQSTLVDLLSHRTGLERADAFWAQSHNNILLSREQALPTISQLRAVTPFRAEYRYNNWGFEVAGQVIEKLSGKQYSDFLSERLFKPLGMTRTFNNDSECHGDPNVAKGYMTYDDASACPVPRPHMAEGTLMNPAGGIQSTINDLLKYYKALMKAANDQYLTGETSTPGSPIKQASQILSSNIRTAPRLREQAYAMGWARVQLPGILCDTSRNQAVMKTMPVVGNPDHPRLALYHHGMLVGFTGAVYLFPESETAIVLLSNAVAINDGPDWIGHLLIQTLFQDPQVHDYTKLARETLSFGLSSYERIERELKAEVVNYTEPKPLDSYVGKYYNAVRTFFMNITLKEGELWMNLQGNAAENYRLKHHDGDVFNWHMPRNEQIERGRNPITYMEYWKIKFEFGGSSAAAQKIFWVIEKDLPGDGMELVKDTDDGHSEL